MTQKNYYVALLLTNQSPNDVTVSYLRNGELKEQDIPKLAASRITINFTSQQQPSAVEFKAFVKNTSDILKINGSESISITPTEQIEVITANIGTGLFL